MLETFTKDRTKICEDLMRPEIRPLLDLPLDKKIEKSKEIIKEALEKYSKVGLGFSGGTDSLVLLHLVKPLKHNIPCVFIVTQHEFPETYGFVNKVVLGWDIKDYQKVRADEVRTEEFKKKFGYKTPEFTVAYDGYHKIAPMMKAIGDRGFDAFLVGLRGVEHEERAKETFFSQRKNPDHIRVHPLLFWRQSDILEYVKKFNLECNPLYAKGYTSLGCTIFSEKNTDPNAHERAGRGVVREEVMAKLRELGYT
ncbi:phosphoadenosine phosphosulfate reductase family protein [Candidatus Pacearchaeota archaeon]|nr:phosphoadenosine phosphosulfate reductase family protein [Candidatus Pacearchaeota archaeon]